MSTEPAIRIRGLSKCYRIYRQPEDRLKQMILRRRRYYTEFWALHGIDLDIHRGETVGILGRNGSGKTTLLQLITGTLTPTEGSIEARGKIAALLGLGAGFNPEFSGRENVVLNATLLGMTTAEIADAFPRIAEFAELGEFLDRPVKTYSSGMYSRLAFAVAIHVSPDILIVDETLSVGDEAFQRKCFVRLAELKQQGVTILFVSHSAATIIELCDRAVLLDHGRQVLSGPPKTVVAHYQRMLHAAPTGPESGGAADADATEPASAAAGPRDEPSVDEFFDPDLTPTTTTDYPQQGAVILDPHIETPAGRRVNTLIFGRPYRYRYRVRLQRSCLRTNFAYTIRTLGGIEVAGQLSHRFGEGIELAEGTEVDVVFPFVALMAPGDYLITSGVATTDDGGIAILHRRIDVLMYRVRADAPVRMAGLVDCTVPGRPAVVVGMASEREGIGG